MNMRHEITSIAKTIIFLKNYQRFISQIRENTAKVYFDVLEKSDDKNLRNAMTLRLVEEFMAASEDLTMWLAAISKRNSLPVKYRDIEEYLLDCHADDPAVKDVLKKLTRIRTVDGLIKKLRLPKMNVLTRDLNMPEDAINLTVSKILESIKATYSNRTGSRGALVRYHNKIKHGMMVSEENGEMLIKDLKIKYVRISSRYYRKYRNFTINENIEKSRDVLGSIHALSQMIHLLASILLVDTGAKLQGRGKRMGKRQREILAKTLEYSNA